MVYKLKARNNELEKTVKSLYHKSNNEDNTTKRNDETQDSSRPDSNSTRNNNDGLVNAITGKVSGYILRKVDKEIEHLIRLEENVNNTPAETYHYGYYDYPFSTPNHSQHDVYYSNQQQSYHYPYYQHDNWSYNHHYYPDWYDYQEYSNSSNLITVQLEQETGNIDKGRNQSQQENERINVHKLKTTKNLPHVHNIQTTRHSETPQYGFTGLNKSNAPLVEGQPIYYREQSKNHKTNSKHFLYQKSLRQPPF
ncbi:unnamed protein product [Mytilus coruscus]|uniref:Uncharacterized protein n=1 Tax=Mytilus coruscus TaxID=42192 RepID=A0A6J7ZTY3_MYTCO|nr:unnamed protein product [Mytilus coruscus]